MSSVPDIRGGMQGEVAARATFAAQIASWQARMEQALEARLPAAEAEPTRLHAAMRYCVLHGGKRVRPMLLFSSARAAALTEAQVEAAACAIELVHAYSLVHDDLPAMDNDDLRRGKPTCHKKFGEATAILAGDALLTLAFETIAAAPVDPARRVAMVSEIASAAGTVNGMVGGQVADLEAEGKRIAPEMLEYIHRSKTAALIRASVASGALCAGAPGDDVRRLRRFGDAIGWLFQITDDILDVEESSAALGKTAGKDLAQQKATYPAIHGLERSRKIASDLATKALEELAPYTDRGARLRDIAQFLVTRRS
jgi:geranylgeranyl pyrophosphate synthase